MKQKPSERIEERKKKASESLSNEKHWNWKGGQKYRQTEGSKERFKEYQRKLRAFRKNLVLEHYGKKCVCCGETEIKFLTIDHIHSDGVEHRKTLGGSGGGSIIIAWIVKNCFPENMFQILCYNCNLSKGVYGECPHKDEVYEAEQKELNLPTIEEKVMHEHEISAYNKGIEDCMKYLEDYFEGLVSIPFPSKTRDKILQDLIKLKR